MPITVDKLLGKPLLHTHTIDDIIVGTSSNTVDTTGVVTVATTTTPTDATVILVNAVSGAVTINLPQASTVTNKIYKIKKIDSSANVVNVDGYSGETIDGDPIVTIMFMNSAMQIVSNGTAWYII